MSGGRPPTKTLRENLAVDEDNEAEQEAIGELSIMVIGEGPENEGAILIEAGYSKHCEDICAGGPTAADMLGLLLRPVAKLMLCELKPTHFGASAEDL